MRESKPSSRTQPREAPASEQELQGEAARGQARWLWGPLLGWGLPVLAFVVLLCVGWPLYLEHDTGASPLQSGRGVVTSVAAGAVASGLRPPEPAVTIRLGSRTVYDVTYTPLRVGQAVQVQYRVGKSGHIYLEDVQPAKP